MSKPKTTTKENADLTPRELAAALMKGSANISLSFDGASWTLKGTTTNDYRELRALMKANKE